MSANTAASRGAAAKRGRRAGNSAGNDPGGVAADARQAIRLSFLIHDVSRMRRTAYDHLMRPLGITRAQWWVLAHLSRHDGMMQTDLAEQLDVGKASLGSLIDRLAAAGLAERREDPADRRAKRVYMAPAGRQLLKRMTAAENLFNSRILGALSSADKATMILMLSTIKEALSRHTSGVPLGVEE
jgi:MarR family transcriptional regulator, transcriptional regulator for hemolysin